MGLDEDEVLKHNKPNDAWVIYKGRVLNITSFLNDHPGGSEIIEPYLGKDITKQFDENDHSENAIKMTKNMEVGDLTKPSKPEENLTIDPTRGLVYQVFTKLNLKAYQDFVNDPKHTKTNIRVFDSPILEPFSKTPWYAIPIFWIPFMLFYSYCGLELGFIPFICLFLLGIAWWTLFEYSLHRFIFHSEPYLPDNPYWIVFHFLSHGIHHAYPMDNLRLVFPIALSLLLWLVFKPGLYNHIMPIAVADAFFAGKLVGYMYYDLFHYYSHHSRPHGKYFSFMKTYHMAHHYKDPFKGFGVSNHFWDIVFGTLLPVTYRPTSLD
ncbi:unnamed protein product [Blepharisma stoltei]|uniref:Fatty acid 2-hydroxylase n=1 Tax=Blepharisma stoltei TaxID=1481888 RepID=A0AAU9IYI9_9CILI|nr:unnamed protein product [Blepharisma stoltei]